MDVTKLKAITQEVPLAKSVFNVLASRSRPREVTDLRRLRQTLIDEEGLAINPREFLELFKRLQVAGYGTVINPKIQTDPHRFKWKYNLIEVGQRALGLKKDDAPVSSSSMSAAPVAVENRIRTSFPVGGELVHIDLPLGLTKKQAQELAEFIGKFGR
jgi:hypothetical protein